MIPTHDIITIKIVFLANGIRHDNNHEMSSDTHTPTKKQCNFIMFMYTSR